MGRCIVSHSGFRFQRLVYTLDQFLQSPGETGQVFPDEEPRGKPRGSSLERKFIILSPAQAGSWVHTQYVLNLLVKCYNYNRYK